MMLVSNDEFFKYVFGIEKPSQSSVCTDDLGKQNLGKRGGSLYNTNSWTVHISYTTGCCSPKNLD